MTKPPKVLIAIVTRDDIRWGRVGNAEMCPIARSLNRRYGGVSNVGGIRVRHYPKGPDYGTPGLPFRTTTRARDFISKFDSGIPVEPAKFLFKRIRKR